MLEQLPKERPSAWCCSCAQVGVESAPGIELAAERAEAIIGWLIEHGGVSVSRLRMGGGGSGGGGGGGTRGGGGGSSGSGHEGATGSSGSWHIRFNVIAEIKISDKLEFDGGSDCLRDESQKTLRAVAEVLKARRDVGRLTIEGHTCSDGPEVWNMQLSRAPVTTCVECGLRHSSGLSF